MTLVVRPAPPARGDNLATLAVTVGPDGTFAIEVPPATTRCLPGQPQPPGERHWELLAEIGERVAQPGTILATAIFTVSSSPATLPGLPNTGGGGAQARAALPGNLVVAGGLAALIVGLTLCYGRFWRWVR